MKSDSLFLKPFPASGLLPDIKIAAEICREQGMLKIGFELTGALPDLSIPAKADALSRRNELWEDTCFEFFLKPAGSEKYWECNLSPSGDWNVYSFESYRQGMQEEKAFTSLPFGVLTQQDILRLSLRFDLDKIVPADHFLTAAISSVIRDISGKTTYWALAHPGLRPDFHHKDCFVIEL